MQLGNRFSDVRPCHRTERNRPYARYGVPSAQRFVIRPGIRLMVSYGTDQAACQMVVEPTRSIIPRDEPAKYMRPEVVTEIIDEILPEAERGDKLLGISHQEWV